MKSDAIALSASRSRAADFIALTKPRLNLLVLVTTAVGYYLGTGGSIDFAILAHTVIGTGFVAGGAAALNQLLERDVDGLMQRTRTRPLPEGRVQPSEARAFGTLLSVVGLLQLALGANVLAAGIALVTLVSYLALYTPLKRRSSIATLVGAVPGALPPVIGWTAARNELSIEAWLLFGIVFVWQIPHFLAIAWLYRHDYERAGIPLLPVLEPDGVSTARQVLIYVLALVPISLGPAIVGLAGRAYVAAALVLGAIFLFAAVQFAVNRTQSSARRLFLTSIAYLPLLWTSLLLFWRVNQQR